jgi:preprotein translocase subunit SecD
VTVTIPVHVADKAIVSDAVGVFSKRLKALGIGNFTVTTGDTMRFVILVPLTFDSNLVDAVLKRPGVIEFVPCPEQPPAPGDRLDVTAEPIVGGAEISSAVMFTDSTGHSAVKITLGAVGTQAMATYTAAHISGCLPLLLDGTVLTDPFIQAPITGGELLITGPDTGEIPMAALTAIISAGPLPEAWTRQP